MTDSDRITELQRLLDYGFYTGDSYVSTRYRMEEMVRIIKEMASKGESE